jgi:hypothetical protein
MIPPDITNADRAQWALFALGDFVNRTGVHDEEEAIGDLIADLLHLARAADLDPALIAQQALACMKEEASEDAEGDMNAVLKSFNGVIRRAVDLALPARVTGQT